MRILCTFPGKFGDILWAMPTVRAISRHFGQPVDFCLSEETATLLPLLSQQEYIGRAWSEGWEWHGDPGKGEQIIPKRDFTVGHAELEEAYDRVFHLHYRGWPKKRLAWDIWEGFQEIYGIRLGEVDLSAWIQRAPGGPNLLPGGPNRDVAVGFSEEWFELKVGLVELLRLGNTIYMPFGRWQNEFCTGLVADWPEAAYYISHCKLFLGCLSAMSVLAAALGKPRVLVEPNSARWNPIFQHWDTELVKGGDGNPTFDARHVMDAVLAARGRS